jgi:hypothetical protein
MRNLLLTVTLMTSCQTAPEHKEVSLGPLHEKAPLACARPQLELLNGAQWITADDAVEEQAKVQCAIRYPDSPCLRYMSKTPELNYRIICGAKS